MRFWKQTFLFALGGCGYMGLECLWRGWSHGSMFLAGGSAFLLLGKLERPLAEKGWLTRSLAASGAITAVELAAGLLFNRSYTVWDYRQTPLNFKGQICLPFSLLWAPIGLGGMALYRALNKRI